MLKAFAALLLWASVAEASRSHGLPEPYGHTAQISPHNPNSDREWYTEYRWKDNQKYKPQDGDITVQPKHAPVPKQIPEEQKRDRWGKPLNKKPVPKTASESNATKAQASVIKAEAGKAPAAAKEKDASKKSTNATAIKAKYESDSGVKNTTSPSIVKEEKKKKEQNLGGAVQAKKVEPTYAVPKPCGHTSMVHPTHGNRDREWYTEYRWKAGNEYKPQDGPITEKPKTALRGITRSPDGEPCVEIRS